MQKLNQYLARSCSVWTPSTSSRQAMIKSCKRCQRFPSKTIGRIFLTVRRFQQDYPECSGCLEVSSNVSSCRGVFFFLFPLALMIALQTERYPVHHSNCGFILFCFSIGNGDREDNQWESWRDVRVPYLIIPTWLAGWLAGSVAILGHKCSG